MFAWQSLGRHNVLQAGQLYSSVWKLSLTSFLNVFSIIIILQILCSSPYNVYLVELHAPLCACVKEQIITFRSPSSFELRFLAPSFTPSSPLPHSIPLYVTVLRFLITCTLTPPSLPLCYGCCWRALAGCEHPD